MLTYCSRNDYSLDGSITIHVSNVAAARTFVAQKAVLARYSAYFRATLTYVAQGSFAEAADGSITLEGESPNTFAVFLDWLSIVERGHDGTIFVPESQTNSKFQRLVKLWIFGDRRVIPLLQNEALSAIWRLIEETKSLPLACTPLVYAQTTEDSPLRHFLLYCYTPLESHEIARCLTRFSYEEEALNDVLAMLNRRRQPNASADFHSIFFCSYFHIHEPRSYCDG